MNLDGSFHSIKTKSSNRRTDEDFKDIEKYQLNGQKCQMCLNHKKQIQKSPEICGFVIIVSVIK